MVDGLVCEEDPKCEMPKLIAPVPRVDGFFV